METQNPNENEQQENSQPNDSKGGIHNNALYAASMGRAATAQVRHHSGDELAQTGTNIIYEGPTAPGGGGSAGTGYTSGQAGTSTSISSDSDYDRAAVGRSHDHTAQDNPDASQGEGEAGTDEQR